MRLKAQAPITPASAPAITKPPVKDLTATLMENQLMQMSTPATSWTPPKQASSPTNPPNSFGAFQSTPALPWGGGSNSLASGNQWSGSPGMIQGSGMTMASSASINNGWSLTSPVTRQAGPPIGGMMNSMMMSPQQMSSSNSFGQSGTLPKPLSASEINDLLS